MKFLKSLLIVTAFLGMSCVCGFAEELKIVFTGQTYAMLYPCACPMSPAGGVARRATVIKEMRAASANLVVVEAGMSFASGPEDEYAQNTEADKSRTFVYLDALKMIGYDAVLVSGQEYSFGSDFIKERKDIPFVTSNVEKFPAPFIIKDLGWIKAGILGLTDSSVRSKGVRGWRTPQGVLKERVAALRAEGVGLIIVLSSLSQAEEAEAFRDCPGVDVIINGAKSLGSVRLANSKGALYMTTWWQSKQIGVLTLDIVGSKIIQSKLDAVNIDPQVTDDAEVVSLLPACFMDANCAKIKGSKAQCENAGLKEARCSYSSIPEFSVTVVRPRLCYSCRIEKFIAELRTLFRAESLKIDMLWDDDPRAEELKKEFKITMLPAYIFDKGLEKSKNFSGLKDVVIAGKDSYFLKPSSSGVSYLLGRKRIPKRLDVFFTFSDQDLSDIFELLNILKQKYGDLDVRIYFIAAQDEKGNIISKNGPDEVEEFAKAACVAKIVPEKLLDYLRCRVLQNPVMRRRVCTEEAQIDLQKINACMMSSEGRAALLERIVLAQELEIASGPTFVVENTEIFSTVHAPSMEEFEKAVVIGEDKGPHKQGVVQQDKQKK